MREIEDRPVVEAGLPQGAKRRFAGGPGSLRQARGVFAQRSLSNAQLGGVPAAPDRIDPLASFGNLRPEALCVAEQSVAALVFL